MADEDERASLLPGPDRDGVTAAQSASTATRSDQGEVFRFYCNERQYLSFIIVHALQIVVFGLTSLVIGLVNHNKSQAMDNATGSFLIFNSALVVFDGLAVNQEAASRWKADLRLTLTLLNFLSKSALLVWGLQFQGKEQARYDNDGLRFGLLLGVATGLVAIDTVWMFGLPWLQNKVSNWRASRTLSA